MRRRYLWMLVVIACLGLFSFGGALSIAYAQPCGEEQPDVFCGYQCYGQWGHCTEEAEPDRACIWFGGIDCGESHPDEYCQCINGLGGF